METQESYIVTIATGYDKKGHITDVQIVSDAEGYHRISDIIKDKKNATVQYHMRRATDKELKEIREGADEFDLLGLAYVVGDEIDD